MKNISAFTELIAFRERYVYLNGASLSELNDCAREGMALSIKEQDI
jgi:hypothetical protein